MDLNIKIINNKLLFDYYNYYNSVISYISNLTDIMEIKIAMSYLMDDYNDNAKQLYKIMNDINKDWIIEQKNVIKYILTILNNIFYDNLDNKFKKLHKC